MRKRTLQRYHGRAALGGTLKGAILNLEAALREIEKPQETELSKRLKAAASSLELAARDCETYRMGRKRLARAIENEIARVKALHKEVCALPITPGEKLVARRESKRKGGIDKYQNK